MIGLFRNRTELLIFLYGLASVLEVFRIQLGSVKINISDLFFILLLFCLFRKKTYKNQKESRGVSYLRKTLFIIIAFSINFFVPLIDEIWENSGIDGLTPAFTYSIKSLFNLIFFILLFSVKYNTRKSFATFYCYGFLAAIAVNIVYSTYQMISWYLFAVDVHTPIMESFGITEDFLGHPVVNYVMIPVLRASGLFWDPYYLGILGIIGITCSIYIKRKGIRYFVLFFIILNWLLTFSRTGYVAAIGLLTVLFLYKRYNKTLALLLNFRKVYGFMLIIFILLSLTGVYVVDKEVTENIKEGFFTKNSLDTDNEGDMRHAYYPIYAIEAVLRDPFHLFLGYGARNSSRALYLSDNVKDAVSNNTSFDIESDWCKCLIDSGLICFIFYLVFHYRIIKQLLTQTNFQSSMIGLFYTTSIICVFLGGFFYCINDSRWVWMLYAGGICYLDSIKRNEEKNICKR